MGQNLEVHAQQSDSGLRALTEARDAILRDNKASEEKFLAMQKQQQAHLMALKQLTAEVRLFPSLEIMIISVWHETAFFK